jgi:hypothetical protein
MALPKSSSLIASMLGTRKCFDSFKSVVHTRACLNLSFQLRTWRGPISAPKRTCEARLVMSAKRPLWV